MKKGCIGSSPTASGRESILAILYAPNGSLPMRVTEDDASLVTILVGSSGRTRAWNRRVGARRGLRGRPRLLGWVAGGFRASTRAPKACRHGSRDQIETVVFPFGLMLLICGGHDAGHYGSC